MTRARLSIIVMNYNYGRFLTAAIDSALAQTYPDVEVVVVDDGSTDHSRDVIAAAGSGIVPILKANGGQASALNAGFASSTGDVILLLDADDMLLPTTGERVVAALAEQPDATKVHYPLLVVNAAGEPTGELMPRLPLSSGDLRLHVLGYGKHVWPPTSGSAFPRHVLERLLPMPEEPYRICADNYLALLAPLFGPVVALPTPGARYRRHGGNQFALDQNRLIESYLAYLRNRIVDTTRKSQTRACQLRVSRELGLPPPCDRSRPDALHRRLISLKLEPAQHPVASDALLNITWQCVQAVLVSEAISRWPERLLRAGWLVAVAAAPRPVSRWLVEQSYFPRSGGWLDKAVGGLRRRQIRAQRPTAMRLQEGDPELSRR